MAERYGMAPAAFEATVRATCMPGANVSKEHFAAFLLVAKEYGLNPLTKELYAFPAKGGGIQPIVSIDGWMRMINDHPACDGVEFEDHVVDGKLEAITCRIYRKDRSRPTLVTEYMAECRRNTDVWRQWPSRMLRHKAAIQAARYAFGFSGIMDPDEWERLHSVTAVQPTGLRERLTTARTTPPTEGFTAAHGNVVEAEIVTVDLDTGEITEAATQAPIEPEPANRGFADGFDDADNIRDPDDEIAPTTLDRLALRLETAATDEDITIIAREMTPDLKALPIEEQAQARKKIVEARKAIGGGNV
jgi:phage recombination protein Bet